jgi:hypothetical protein
MILIKNCADWITPTLMNQISTHTGDLVPVWQPDRWKGHPLLDEATERARPGYSHKDHNFYQFNPSSKDMQGFPFQLPTIPEDDRPTLWWIIKLEPGQLQAMHFDPHLIEIKNPARYSVFLQDWQPGHIYTWDDKMISNYKAGDMYKWSDPLCYHGAVNIGYETRYTLQITTYDS